MRPVPGHGRHLGIVLAPIVSALDLTEVVLAGPAGHIAGPLLDTARSTLLARTLADTPPQTAMRRHWSNPRTGSSGHVTVLAVSPSRHIVLHVTAAVFVEILAKLEHLLRRVRAPA